MSAPAATATQPTVQARLLRAAAAVAAALYLLTGADIGQGWGTPVTARDIGTITIEEAR